MTGNQNEGCIFKESNRSAFMLRRKTRGIEQIEWKRAKMLK